MHKCRHATAMLRGNNLPQTPLCSRLRLCSLDGGNTRKLIDYTIATKTSTITNCNRIAPRCFLGLTFPDIDLVPKRHEKFSCCRHDLVQRRGISYSLPDVALVGSEKFSTIFIKLRYSMDTAVNVNINVMYSVI